MFQAKLKQDWIDEAFAIPYQFLKYGPSLSQYKYFGSMEMSTETRIPAVRAACSAARVLSYSNTSMLFPTLSQASCWTSASSSLAEVTSLNTTATNQVRVTWVPLSSEVGSASGGIVVEVPSVLEQDSRAVITCSLDARWTNGTIFVYHLEDQSSIEKIAHQIVVATALLDAPVPASRWRPGYSDFSPVISSPSSQKIVFDSAWLKILTQSTNSADLQSGSRNIDMLERILSDYTYTGGTPSSAQAQTDQWNQDSPGKVNRTVALEWWLSLLVTDGLSRLGSAEVLDTTGPQTNWTLTNYQKAANFRNELFSSRAALLRPNSTAIIEEKVTISIGGYSYISSSITDYLSAALLLLHILMALTHTVYTVWWTHRSSSSWDSLTELLVLMQNSKPPTNALTNAGAGISHLNTYSRRAAVRAIKTSTDNPETKQKVELVFSSDADCYPIDDSALEQGIGPGTLRRSYRLESVSSVHSKSPLLAADDVEFANLDPTSVNTMLDHGSRTGGPRRRVLSKVLPDVKYR